MMKLLKTLGLLLLISTAGFSQKELPEVDKTLFFLKGGIGTSWIIMPKVFLISPDTTSAQILPATNSFTGYLGFQAAIPLGKRWLFMPEVDFNYLSGEVRVDRIINDSIKGASQKLQSYARIEVPLNFGVVSSDDFWVSFGPVIFFTISDNKGFDAAVYEIADPNRVPPLKLESDNPIGVRFRLAAYIVIARGRYIDIKFDSDLIRDFHYTENDDVYHMKMSMQSITVGFGFSTNRDR